MIVEDDADIREAVCELLHQNGFVTLSAENGRDALNQLHERPDVRAIVLDVTMPVMNGATFRGEQLADPSIAHIPLVLLTGREDSGPIARALGAVACLPKPFSPDDLLRVLSSYA
jgi:CheY-like chemotaxis protein